MSLPEVREVLVGLLEEKRLVLRRQLMAYVVGMKALIASRYGRVASAVAGLHGAGPSAGAGAASVNDTWKGGQGELRRWQQAAVAGPARRRKMSCR